MSREVFDQYPKQPEASLGLRLLARLRLAVLPVAVNQQISPSGGRADIYLTGADGRRSHVTATLFSSEQMEALAKIRDGNRAE